MRAAVSVEPRKLVISEDYPMPELRPGDVLVEVELCGICGSDLMDWYVAQKVPAVLGHEIVGRVAKLDPKLDHGLLVGDRVFVHHHVACGTCRLCRRGKETLCPSFRSSRIEPGGLAQFVRVPSAHVADGLLHLPDGLSGETATMIEPLACALRGLKSAGASRGDRALVVGLGQMGQLYSRALIAEGVSVVGTDLLPARRTLAAAVGVVACAPLPEEISANAPAGDPWDLIVLCTGHADAFALGFAAAGKGSVVQLFAPPPPGGQLCFDANRLFFDEITLQASYSAVSRDTLAALSLLASGHLDTTGIVSHRFPLERAAEAMETARRQDSVMKVVVEASSPSPSPGT